MLKNHIIRAALASFMGRLSDPLRNRLHIIETPTEELLNDAKNGPTGGAKMLFAGSGARARLEENYLFDTRRFPSFVTGETFPALLPTGDYTYFANNIGGNAANNGFSPNTTPTMSPLETNMDTPSQIPQGKNFVMTQVGVSFNSDISSADAAALLESGHIVFQKQGGQFQMHHGSPKLWGGGTGLTTSLASGSPASNGLNDIRAVRKLAVPRVLEQRSNFAYKYIVPRSFRNTEGSQTEEETSTATTLSAPAIMTIWLWGGQEDAIPT